MGRVAACVGIAAFAVGVAWFAAFPLITVSTGELKPRGTFISENALPRRHAPTVDAVDAALPSRLAARYAVSRASSVASPSTPSSSPSMASSRARVEWWRAELAAAGAVDAYVQPLSRHGTGSVALGAR